MKAHQIRKLVEAVHATPPMVVINFAGAGSQAITWLHSIGGSSRTLLEATDIYAAESLVDLIGFEPEQFVSPQVARAIATKAHLRACYLTHGNKSVAGIGCTATIATDRTKRGQHRCCVAVCNAQGVMQYSLVLTKGLRTRQQEERLVSLLILRAVAQVCNIDRSPSLPLTLQEPLKYTYEPADLLTRLQLDDYPLVAAWPDGRLMPGEQHPNEVLLSGSFNPLHAGHKKLAGVVTKMLDKPVKFELPLINADKAAIDVNEAWRRVAQFSGFAPLFLTRAPLFDQKAKLFPHSIFVIGVDTAARLIEARFYDDDENNMLASLDEIRLAGCRFMVAGRVHNGQFLTVKDLSLPRGFRELFTDIPETQFREDISSTELREQT